MESRSTYRSLAGAAIAALVLPFGAQAATLTTSLSTSLGLSISTLGPVATLVAGFSAPGTLFEVRFLHRHGDPFRVMHVGQTESFASDFMTVVIFAIRGSDGIGAQSVALLASDGRTLKRGYCYPSVGDCYIQYVLPSWFGTSSGGYPGTFSETGFDPHWVLRVRYADGSIRDSLITFGGI